MNYILFDDQHSDHLLPLTYTRPTADLRVGILTIREKWERYLSSTTSTWARKSWLRGKFPMKMEAENRLINGTICPDKSLLEAIAALQPRQALMKGERLLAANATATQLQSIGETDTPESIEWQPVHYTHDFFSIERPWHIFGRNGEAIEADFELLTAGRKSAPISSTNTLIGNRIFAEPGATVEAAILNSTNGPIYLGADSTVMEGAMIRGPFALCDHAEVKLGAKIYGPTTIGPHSKVGGEVNNAVLTGYSNKGHDGFLGNAVLGEWCNLGADTNNSNLKNNYSEVRVWNYPEGRFVKTGLTFCGLIMGDHSKCGINTMFNTGTVVGVFANIFGAGFPRNFIPSFSWGGASGMLDYRVDKTFEVAELVMQRRGIELTAHDREILTAIYNETARYRTRSAE